MEDRRIDIPCFWMEERRKETLLADGGWKDKYLASGQWIKDRKINTLLANGGGKDKYVHYKWMVERRINTLLVDGR